MIITISRIAVYFITNTYARISWLHAVTRTYGYSIAHRVNEYEADNRMSLQNLATVFGPTVLRPPEDEPKPTTIEQMFTSGAHEVVMQTTMLLAVFGLRKRGVSFWAQ